MQTIELRSLLDGTNKKITIPKELGEIFEDWKAKRAGEDIQPLEIFYAGYILANPMVKDLFKKDKGKLKV